MSLWTNQHQWTGRDDKEDGERGFRWHHVTQQRQLDQLKKQTNTIALVGFACDIGVANNKGRIGAQQGPQALRQALANQAWHNDARIIDLGTVTAQPERNNALDIAQQHYGQVITASINHNPFTIGLGGGHEIAWGSYQGLINSDQITPETRVGILNFDAHFDLRQPAPVTSSGTPFRQIAEHCQQHQRHFDYCCLGIAETANTRALFDYAKTTNTHYLLDKACTVQAMQRVLIPFLSQIDVLYVTVCLDVFPAHTAPGVSAPSSLGIDVGQVIETLHWLSSQQQTLNFTWPLIDIAELNPHYDIDHRTAKLAARIIHEVLSNP